jgi:hypothetical protein
MRTIQRADHERVRSAILGGFDQLDAQQIEAEEKKEVLLLGRIINPETGSFAPGRFRPLARPIEKLLAPLGIIRFLSFPNAILGVLLVLLGE